MSRRSQIREDQWGAKAIIDQELHVLIVLSEFANSGMAARRVPEKCARRGQKFRFKLDFSRA